ncbi:uncharacterized protein LOC118477139 [Aplysia californica]|uniref:Uncharacterized protein LOC118477139 n=1 Tax=Aplysia californica TaxID=6500 RepID=A0ABM1VP85_APLCA|nr:uncharacterized protein LOC118477139 [Aplysia californica]XP_035824227.1 uncharacterized protein LOC118477139 [Aplysia californica]
MVKDLSSYYNRGTACSFGVPHFLERNAIDFPGKKGSVDQKKVLTKSMVVLFKELKKTHPNVKISFATFKRRRPQSISLSSSRKFLQCLCERCTNVMLLMEVLNKEISNRITSIEALVEQTLCQNVERMCIERQCPNCGVNSLIQSIKGNIEDLTVVRKWSKWEKSEKASKDLVFHESPLSEILSLLEKSVHEIAKHLKVAEWQRKQYQSLKFSLPRGHAMCTVDFAENYLCKFQNEVQSAHWSYRQVSVHPCVFF